MRQEFFLAFVLLVAAARPARLQQPTPLFRAEARVVEVYATVLDHRGRYLDGIPRAAFHIRDNGQLQPIASFESNASKLSCAILMDTTGSMRDSLPTIKNAIRRLIDELRDEDAVAVYGFNTTLALLQDFTADKSSALTAVMRTRAAGRTALFDALTRVMLDIAGRGGKKAVVVYTDGDDNSSSLNPQAVIDRAKKSAIPVYTVAQGEARHSESLMKKLREMARLTGGQTYGSKDAHESARIFQDISAELQHTYMLSYRPESRDQSWHQIRVSLDGVKDYVIRSKEGYFPE